MKGLVFYIRNTDLESIKEVLQKNDVEGISYFEIVGRGKLERGEVEKIIDGYRSGKKFVPEFVTRKRVEVVIPDSEVDKILNEVKKSGNIHGKLFIYDVPQSYDLP